MFISCVSELGLTETLSEQCLSETQLSELELSQTMSEYMSISGMIGDHSRVVLVKVISIKTRIVRINPRVYCHSSGYQRLCYSNPCLSHINQTGIAGPYHNHTCHCGVVINTM